MECGVSPQGQCVLSLLATTQPWAAPWGRPHPPSRAHAASSRGRGQLPWLGIKKQDGSQLWSPKEPGANSAIDPAYLCELSKPFSSQSLRFLIYKMGINNSS